MDIVLATLNSRYGHCSLALRYLFANLQGLRPRASLCEFTINQPPEVIAASLLALEPRILGLGVYIWNTTQTLQLITILKQRCPPLKIIIGGPEVTYESENQSICQLADYVIQGEGDFAFRNLCEKILNDQPSPKFIRAETPEINHLVSPYAFYNDEDVRQRTIYVEASRGCPYHCEFCLSSLDDGVRNFPLPAFFADLKTLLDRGVRQFKFIDRTFNLNIKISSAILKFFLENIHLSLFLHFELVPDRLPEELKTLIAQFPIGSLQFEIGIQTWDLGVAALISRKQDYAKTEDNLRFLRTRTGVYIHADLIAGLPGEDEAAFARGFDRLLALDPHEIQVGMLKRLKGTPIIRHDEPWGMVYDSDPPFAIRQTKMMPSETVQRIAHFAKFWDRLANSGEFPQTMNLLKATAKDSFYAVFMRISNRLYDTFQRTHSIELDAFTAALAHCLPAETTLAQSEVHRSLALDYSSGGKRDLPQFLRAYQTQRCNPQPRRKNTLPKRQQRHLSLNIAASDNSLGD